MSGTRAFGASFFGRVRISWSDRPRGEKVELSKPERVILINQYEILKRLDPGDAAYYDVRIEILSRGFKIFYDDELPWVDADMAVEESREVLDILTMYRVLDSYYRDNPGSPAEQRHLARFRGFDGNEEARQSAFASLLRQQGKFSESLSDEGGDSRVDSHFPYLRSYRQMLDVWQSLENRYDLTDEQVQEIVDAA